MKKALILGIFFSSFLIGTVFAETSLIPTLLTGSSEYYQGTTGSIYYILTDNLGNAISGANVIFTLRDASNNILNSPDPTAIHTTAGGLITLVPGFSLASDSEIGTYNLTVDALYFDAYANRTLNSTALTTFLVQSGSGGGGGGLDSYVATQVVGYPNNIITFLLWFSFNGNATDPDNFTLIVNDPAGNRIINAGINDTRKMSAGLYNYTYAMNQYTATGPYFAILDAHKKNFLSHSVAPFRIAAGGPYDLRLNILRSEVEKPGNISFEITIVNNGEVGQNVSLEYYITAENVVWNNKTEVISVYVDLRETYFSQTLNKYWNSLFLPRLVLDEVPDLNDNYSIQNVLSSLGNNYEILYYYNEDTRKWMSYSPNRPLNDLTEFIDNSNKPYWIKMKTSDKLVIP